MSSSNIFPAVPFTVTVKISNLYIRKTPSKNGKTNGYTGRGTFTITEVNGEWGKLKSGAGWIYLVNPSYCTINKPAEKDYSKIGKLVENCLSDIKKLESYKAILECLGE